MTTEAGDTERRMLLAFRVDGKARPKGSFEAIPVRKRNGRLGIWWKPSSPDCALWATHVKVAAEGAVSLVGSTVGDVTGFPTVLPVRVVARFGFKRPGRTTVEGNEYAPISRTTFGDVDKLVRNILDALTVAGVYRDDCLVTKVDAEKLYVTDGEVAHTMIEVWEDW